MCILLDDEIKKIELNILLAIRDFCEKENIRYCLAYGTLLGSIRHNGFIPWDDDIDLFMPYEDYISFNEKFTSSNYYLENWNIVHDYWLDFTKVVDSTTKIVENNNVVRSTPGLFVDIFPLVGFGSNFEKAKKHLKKIEKMKVKIKYANTQKNILSPNLSFTNKVKKTLVFYFSKIYLKFIKKDKFIDRFNKLLSKYSFDDSAYVAYVDMDGGFMNTDKLFEKSVFLNFEKRFKFETYDFPVPVQYEKFLTIQYGSDYMQIPDEDKRISHNINAYKVS